MAIILVVDDEVGIRELLSEILIDEGYDVRLAENAQAARKARQEMRPDLVLLDIWMPDTDGISLLKEWHSSGQLSMPVVMMSGHGTIDTAVEATRFGACDFLEKPVSLQKLLGTVQKALKFDAPQASTPLTLDAFARLAFVKEFRRRLEQTASRTSILLLRGATGNIAELAARTLHVARTPGPVPRRALRRRQRAQTTPRGCVCLLPRCECLLLPAVPQSRGRTMHRQRPSDTRPE